jgi:hypothetical protein
VGFAPGIYATSWARVFPSVRCCPLLMVARDFVQVGASADAGADDAGMVVQHVTEVLGRVFHVRVGDGAERGVSRQLSHVERWFSAVWAGFAEQELREYSLMVVGNAPERPAVVVPEVGWPRCPVLA